MAKSAKSEPNKSQAIRDYFESHPRAKPRKVVADLAAQGIEVTPGFVSSLRSNDKRNGKKKRRSVGRPRNSASNPTATTTAKHVGGMDIKALGQAKKLVDLMGSVSEAKKALDILAEILDAK